MTPTDADPQAPHPIAKDDLFTWSRFKLWVVLTALWAVVRALSSETSLPTWLVRCGFAVGMGVLAYGLAGKWPRRAPAWLPRWILQLLAVLLVMPLASYLAYVITTGTFDVVSLGPGYRNGVFIMGFMGIFFGPWIALGALLRRSEAFAREQALGFRLKSSELERQALDARLRLLQAQVEPHFLFNTLANIRSMVRQSGSDDATRMLDHLIAYLRAALPRLDAGSTTFEHERAIVCAYLELMRMRMPDRLMYEVHIDATALPLHCPPMTLMTFVENAIRHGIDPSENGGTVDLRVTVQGERVKVRVMDTGVGPQARRPDAASVGLINLRERLTLAFDGDAQVSLRRTPDGNTLAEAEFPARPGGQL